jgi:hypothetical protein
MVDESELTPELRATFLAQWEALPKIGASRDEFTVWCNQPNGGYMHCGGGPTLNDASAIVREHEHLVDLIVFSVNPLFGKHGLTAFPDDERDRAEKSSAAHPGRAACNGSDNRRQDRFLSVGELMTAPTAKESTKKITIFQYQATGRANGTAISPTKITALKIPSA